MRIITLLAPLALRQGLEGLRGAIPVEKIGAGAEGLATFLVERFTDQSQRLPAALTRANDRAWKAMEIAIAGESLWGWLDRSEDRAFRQRVRAYLDAEL